MHSDALYILRERERERGQEGDNEEWPQWSYESRRLLGMRKGAGSEGYNSQQGQSLMCVSVCLCNPYASMRERVNERAHRWSCERDGESERASFMCLYLLLRTECSSGPAGQSRAPCDSSALLFGYGA